MANALLGADQIVSAAAGADEVQRMLLGSTIVYGVNITVQPRDAVAQDGNAAFSVVAEAAGDAPVAYQWFVEASGTTAEIAGEEGPQLTLSGLVPADRGNKYRVVVTTASRPPLSSRAAVLSVPGVITITQQPQVVTTVQGGSATFSVSASVNDGSALTYQWQQSVNDGATWSDLTGETSATLSLTDLTTADDGKRYRVVVSSLDSSPVTSASAALNVDPVAITITQHPQDTTAIGGSASFAVTATVNDGSALTYQWEEEALTGGGETWTTRTLPASASWRGPAFGNGTFIAVAYNNNIAATSPDGVTWTQRALPVSANWIEVAYGNGTFVAVAYLQNVAATSPDGITWTQRALPVSANWVDVAYGNGTFVAVAKSGNIAATSPDGVTWTQRTLPASADWSAVAYGNGTFVAIALSDDVAATSPDGVTWTQREFFPEAVLKWQDLTYGNGTFVAVAYGSVAATSPDGVTWTSRLMQTGADWVGVAYANGTFVAVAYNDSSIAATSPDGITWTQRTLPAAVDWIGVAYGNGTFVAIADSRDFAATSSFALQFLSLSGETGQNLSLTNLTTADDGERYRVVVDSPSVEPVTSDAATLSVA